MSDIASFWNWTPSAVPISHPQRQGYACRGGRWTASALPSWSPPRRDRHDSMRGAGRPSALGTLSCHPLFGTLWLTASFLQAVRPVHRSGRARGGAGGERGAEAHPPLQDAGLLCICSALFPSLPLPGVSGCFFLSPRLFQGDESQTCGRR